MTLYMTIIRVFPRRTSMTPRDDYAFVGEPPLIRPQADEVRVSCTFTWDIPEARRLSLAWGQYYDVRLGGPAFNDTADGFTPGLYVRSGVTFTSRGCNNRCPWCLVPQREGRLRELEIQPGHIVQDNNLLQCSQSHLDKVWAMLRGQHGIELSGGLEAALVTDAIADVIYGLRVKQLFLACDTDGHLKPLREAVKRLYHFGRDKLRCYVLLGFNGESMEKGLARLEAVWEAGAMPMAQLWQPAEKWIAYSGEWKHFARRWSRPAIMKSLMANVNHNL